MNEFTHNFFGCEISGRVSDSSDITQISFVDIKTNDAWPRVFSYDKSVRIIESDDDKVLALGEHFQSKNMKGSKVLLLIANAMIKFISMIENTFRSIFGGFSGRGIFGILFVFALMTIMAVISFHAFILAAPFFLISYGLKWHFGRKFKKEIQALQEATLVHLNTTYS